MKANMRLVISEQ